jgi:single-stranded DNA-specific DHH superfamily exonuclease
VASYDIFNGDADGICALHQLRLAQPRDSQLITGVKRDIALLSRVRASCGDELTVLDISLDDNRDALLRLLAAGVRCVYFDHHFAGAVPSHPGLEAHIRVEPEVCTSLLVDEYLEGRFRAWAVVAAFGDNLPRAAERAAAGLGKTTDELSTLRELGECLNYNAYGDAPEDLLFFPADLYRRLQPYVDPLQFATQDPAFERLRVGLREDFEQAAAIEPLIHTSTHYVTVLPDLAWSRRVHGPRANRLASEHPLRAHAVLIEHGGGYRASVRAPMTHPVGADELCRKFVTGGGRPAAAGINRLPAERLNDFLDAFRASFQPKLP